MPKLPELPKHKKQDEADFGEKLVEHCNKHGFFEYPCWTEIKKVDDKNTFYFRQLDNLQIIKLKKIKYEGFMVRITLASSGGTAGVPDYTWVYKQPAYVGIKYDKSWCFIDIDTFVLEKERSKKKSMTEERAQSISIKVINK